MSVTKITDSTFWLSEQQTCFLFIFISWLGNCCYRIPQSLQANIAAMSQIRGDSLLQDIPDFSPQKYMVTKSWHRIWTARFWIIPGAETSRGFAHKLTFKELPGIFTYHSWVIEIEHYFLIFCFFWYFNWKKSLSKNKRLCMINLLSR
jgi:hypothetical protein